MLQNNEESDMVRHEAAEALGGIATPEVLPYLKEWMNRPDAPRVVRESCQIAIDMWEVHLALCLISIRSSDLACAQYENSDQFQYADGLIKTKSVSTITV